jgi:hypothetical protein
MAAKKSNPVPKKKSATIKDLDLKKAKGNAAARDPKGGGGGKHNGGNGGDGGIGGLVVV